MLDEVLVVSRRPQPVGSQSHVPCAGLASGVSVGQVGDRVRVQVYLVYLSLASIKGRVRDIQEFAVRRDVRAIQVA